MSLPFILPQVHPHSWPGQHHSCTQRLHSGPEAKSEAEVTPLISWSFPTEAFTAFINQQWLENHRLSTEETHNIALANLAHCPQAFEFLDVVQPDGNPSQIAMLRGDRRTNPNRIAAADQILNRPLLKTLHEKFNAAQLVATIPCDNRLYISDLIFAFQGGVIKYAQTFPGKGAQCLTSALFILEEGKVVGQLPYSMPLAIA